MCLRTGCHLELCVSATVLWFGLLPSLKADGGTVKRVQHTGGTNFLIIRYWGKYRSFSPIFSLGCCCHTSDLPQLVIQSLSATVDSCQLYRLNFTSYMYFFAPKCFNPFSFFSLVHFKCVSYNAFVFHLHLLHFSMHLVFCKYVWNNVIEINLELEKKKAIKGKTRSSLNSPRLKEHVFALMPHHKETSQVIYLKLYFTHL